MERGMKEDYVAVIALHKCMKTLLEIFNLLHPLLNGIMRPPLLVIGRIGCPSETKTSAAVKAVAVRIRQKNNPQAKNHGKGNRNSSMNNITHH